MRLYRITNNQSYEDNETEYILADTDIESISMFIDHKNRFKYDAWSIAQDSYRDGKFLLLRSSTHDTELYWIYDCGEIKKGVIQ